MICYIFIGFFSGYVLVGFLEFRGLGWWFFGYSNEISI